MSIDDGDRYFPEGDLYFLDGLVFHSREGAIQFMVDGGCSREEAEFYVEEMEEGAR